MADLDPAPPTKCSRCGEPIRDRELVLVEHGDFHVRCWRVRQTEERVRDSKAMIGETRRIIDQLHHKKQQQPPEV